MKRIFSKKIIFTIFNESLIQCLTESMKVIVNYINQGEIT
jgi:hypothetical protein